MSIPEMKNYRNEKIGYKAKLANAIKLRDYTLKTEGLEYETSVEVYNEGDVYKECNCVGITMAYPSLSEPTHIITGTYRLTIGTKEFAKQIKLLEKELKNKIRS